MDLMILVNLPNKLEKKDKIFIKRWKRDLQTNSKSDSGISVKELKLIIKKKKFKNINLD